MNGSLIRYVGKLTNKTINVFFICLTTVLLIITLFVSQFQLSKLETEERAKLEAWALSSQRLQRLVEYASTFFSRMEDEERKYATIWSYAYERLLSTNTSSQEFDFFINIISSNQSIPFAILDESGNLIESHGDIDCTNLRRTSIYDPIPVYAGKDKYYFYYKASENFIVLDDLLQSLIESFDVQSMAELISIPIIVTNQKKDLIVKTANLDGYIPQRASLDDYLVVMADMARRNDPIEIADIKNEGEKLYIYYESSLPIRSLRAFPYILFFAILSLIIGIIILLRLVRHNEQNLVWWGMAKETAHQLGTPISSLTAWIDYFRLNTNESLSPEIINELDKDIDRLRRISTRFSKIGSKTELHKDNIVECSYNLVAYMQNRLSRKIHFIIDPPKDVPIYADINKALFEWVLENLCNNAANAIGVNEGYIHIRIFKEGEHCYIDVSDTGKGIDKKNFKTIFTAGYSTKKRGWGLGLTLCKRIVEDYHNGKIFVKTSTIGKGSTFRIIL